MNLLTRRIGLSLLVVAGMAMPSVSEVQAQDPPAPPPPVVPEEIRENGPPVERPEDEPGPAPGPGLFYVPGEYYPDRNGVVWREGYWAAEQPGWAWIPERWIRQSDGWTFQEGSWVRSRDPRAAAADPAPVAADARPADDEREIVINLPAGGSPSVVRDGVTYNLFETTVSPYAYGYRPLGITPAYTWSPMYGYPGYAGYRPWWGLNYGWGYGGWGYGGWGYPYGFGFTGLGGWGYGIGFGLGFGYRPLLWW